MTKIWTNEMEEKMRREYPTRFNADIAKDLRMTVRQVIYKAREMGLEKEPGFIEKHKAEIYARRNLDTPACRNNPGRFKKGGQQGKEHWYKPGHKLPAELLEQRTRHIRASRRKQTYEELLRIKYGLGRKTKLALKSTVYYIDKSKYETDEK